MGMFAAAAPILAGPMGTAVTIGTAASTGGGFLSSLLMGSAATGSAGLIGAGGSVTALGALSGGATLLSAFGAVTGGLQQAGAQRANAQWGKLAQKQEELAGETDATRIKQQLLEDLASQRAAWGVAGIDQSSGTPVNVASNTAQEGTREIGINREDSFYRRLARRIQTRNSGVAANQSIFSGAIDAAGTVGSYGMNVALRG